MTAQQAARSGTMAQGDLDMLLQVAEQKQKLADLDTADQVDALETASAAVDTRIADEATRHEAILANLEAQKTAEATNYDAWKVNFDKRVGDEKILFDQAVENISDLKTAEDLAYQAWQTDFDARKLAEDRANEDTMTSLAAEAALAKEIQDAALAAIEAESIAEDARHDKRERQLENNLQRVEDSHNAWMTHLEDLGIAEDAQHDRRLIQLREVSDGIDDRYEKEIDYIELLIDAEERLNAAQTGTAAPQEGGFYSRPAPTTGGVAPMLGIPSQSGSTDMADKTEAVVDNTGEIASKTQGVVDNTLDVATKTGLIDGKAGLITGFTERIAVMNDYMAAEMSRLVMNTAAMVSLMKPQTSYSDMGYGVSDAPGGQVAGGGAGTMGGTTNSSKIELHINGPISLRGEDDIRQLAAHIEGALASRVAQRALGTT
jgi:hypothetical protein